MAHTPINHTIIRNGIYYVSFRLPLLSKATALLTQTLQSNQGVITI
ncbi:Uncharacterised protein [Escherichia coli]|nr:hypothetical protein [Escherichia coli]VVY57865.1 Uncharacterised protein [Escherichia coli]VWM85020.1 Uncharacterised protein [Escherichia coli]